MHVYKNNKPTRNVGKSKSSVKSRISLNRAEQSLTSKVKSSTKKKLKKITTKNKKFLDQLGLTLKK